MLLLNRKASVEVLDEERRTALHWAALHGHGECVEALCAVGAADVNRVDRSGQSALFLAVSHKHHRVAAMLAQHGASPRELRYVRTLDLSNRGLESLPSYVMECTNIKKLKLEGNPLSTVPLHLRDGSA